MGSTPRHSKVAGDGSRTRRRDYLAIARKYERDVLSGRVPACKRVKQACARNARDLKRQRANDFPFYFDEAEASRICEGAEEFPHIKGPKAKVICAAHEEERCRVCHPKTFHWRKIVLEPWMIWNLAVCFGWKRMNDGLRRFRMALILVPRKNAKSTLAAIIALLMLASDGEMGAEVYCAATKKDQARLVFDVMRQMAKRTPDFREYFGVHVGAHAISIEETASKCEPLAADADGLDGLNTHFVVIDELHQHRTRALFDVLDTSTGARAQPMLFMITTAGVDTGGVCYEQLTYLRQVLDGLAVDETFFGIEYTIDEEDLDRWDSEAVLRKANPNYGVSVLSADILAAAQKARLSPGAKNNFLTKRLNVWVRAESPGITPDEWRACAVPSLRLEDFEKRPCYMAVDLAEVRDIASRVLLFPEDDGGFAVFGEHYLSERAVEASPIAMYAGWVAEGTITKTDGNVIDFDRIENDIVADVGRFGVIEVCFDPALATRMIQGLQKRLGEKPPIVTVIQNWPTMSAAWDTLEALILNKKIRHNGDPVLAWMVSNVVLKRNDRGERFPVKSGGKDSHNKIDGAFATQLALVRAMAVQEEHEEESVYAQRVREGQPPMHVVG